MRIPALAEGAPVDARFRVAAAPIGADSAGVNLAVHPHLGTLSTTGYPLTSS